MTGLRWSVSLVVLVGLVAFSGSKMPAYAQDDKEVKLEFKAFSGEKTFFQELETVTEQSMKVMGQEVIQKQNQTFYISWTPKKTDGKTLEVVEKIIGVKMKIDIGGNKIEYDSTVDEKNQPQNPMNDFFKALKSLELTLVIDPATMKVTEVKGRKEFVQKLGDTNPQMKPLLENILGEDAIKQMAQPTWGAVPKNPVKKGSTWEDTSDLNLGAIGSYKTTFNYTFEGQEKGKDKIGVKTKLTYKAPDDKGKDSAALPFKIKDNSQLSSTEGSGTVLFDREKGRIESSNMQMKLEGNLVIEVSGMQTTVELKQTQTSKMTTSDTDPLAEKSKAAPSK